MFRRTLNIAIAAFATVAAPVAFAQPPQHQPAQRQPQHAPGAGHQGMDHSRMQGMDHSRMQGMDHSRMPGMQGMSAEEHRRMMQQQQQGGTQPRR